MGEQGGGATRVKKDDRLSIGDLSATPQVDQSRHRLAGVDRFEEDPFGAGKSLDRLDPFGGRYRIGRAGVFVMDSDIILGNLCRLAEERAPAPAPPASRH